jgi:hypothetical protein
MRQVTPLGDAWLLDPEADRRHLGAVHRRCVIFRPGHFVLAIDHIVLTPSRLDATTWWHFAPGLELSRGAGRQSWLAEGLAGGRRLHISHAGNASMERNGLHLGETAPRSQGWVSQAYLEYQPAPALGFPAKTDTDNFAATLFEITRDGAAPELSLDGRASENSIALTDRSGRGTACQSFRFGAFTLETGHALL